MLKKLDNVGLAVMDLEGALHLFRDIFGMEIVSSSEQSFTARLADTRFYVFKSQHPYPQRVDRGGVFAQNKPGLDHLAFEVDDVDTTYAQMKAQGVTFVVDPQNTAYGVRRAVIQDREGNLYTIRKTL